MVEPTVPAEVDNESPVLVGAHDPTEVEHVNEPFESTDSSTKVEEDLLDLEWLHLPHQTESKGKPCNDDDSTSLEDEVGKGDYVANVPTRAMPLVTTTIPTSSQQTTMVPNGEPPTQAQPTKAPTSQQATNSNATKDKA